MGSPKRPIRSTLPRDKPGSWRTWTKRAAYRQARKYCARVAATHLVEHVDLGAEWLDEEPEGIPREIVEAAARDLAAELDRKGCA